MKRITAVLLLAAVLLSSCAKKSTKVVGTEVGFRNDETGIEYVACNFSVTAIRSGEEYAHDSVMKYLLIEYENPERFLTDGTGGFVYRASTIDELDVVSFKPIAAVVFVENETAVFYDRLTAASEYLAPEYSDIYPDDTEYVNAIRDAVSQGEQVAQPTVERIDQESVLHIRLLSAEYPGLYYTIVMFRDTSGVIYLRDRGTRVTVLCPDNVKARLYS